MRRLLAAWIDGAVVYGAAIAVITGAELGLGLRLPLELTFVVLAMGLGVLALARHGRSPGKALCGLRVECRDGTSLPWRRALAREAVKWGVTLGVPLAVARLVIGEAWVATVFDLVVATVVGALVALVVLVTRRTLHDRIAGTRVVFAPYARREVIRGFAAVSASVVIAATVAGVTWSVRGFVPAKLALYRDPRAIGRYVAALEGAYEAPVDYVLRLFERYDIVVLGENLHPETTQWDFIFDLVRDPRFVARVGRVFTEYGYAEDQPALDHLLTTPGLSTNEIDRQAVALMRNIADGHNTGWDNTNFFHYLQRLARLDATLPTDRRIRHFFTDRDPGWLASTREAVVVVERAKINRDERMAKTVIEQLARDRTPPTSTPKALVIMNYRHSFAPPGLGNAAGYLFAAFPGRTANVLLGPYTVPFVYAPLHGGRWDAAWDAIGNRPLGLDLTSTPFGDDAFDLYPFPGVAGRYRYADVYTGMVLVTPLREQRLEYGIPGYMDGFEAELARRAELVGAEQLAYVRERIAWYRAGMPAGRTPHPTFAVQTTVELVTLALFAPGWLWAVIAMLVSRPWRKVTAPVDTAPSARTSRRS